MARNATRIQTVQEDKPELTSPQQPATVEQPLTVNIPTNFVELPSAGRYYPQEHPLHNQEVVEIKFMTTKEEEILNSPALVQRGLAIDRLIRSVLVNKSIDSKTLLIGDKNAILVAARSDAYGSDYEIGVTCPVCAEKNEVLIDLSELSFKENESDIKMSEKGTPLLTLPRTQAEVELRFLTGKDEEIITKFSKKAKKRGIENNLTLQYKQMIVSIDGDSSVIKISNFISDMPAFDSRYLRKKYHEACPDIDLGFDFSCQYCGEEQQMEVPITVNFFWP